MPYAAFLWAGFRTDIYGFFFDGGLLHATPWWRVELALIRLAGKHIVVYPYGGDARLSTQARELGRWNIYSDVPPAPRGVPTRRFNVVAKRSAGTRT